MTETRMQRLREAEERHHGAEQRFSGSGPVNEHPDGCYYCGSTWHRSDACSSPERDRYYEELYG